MMKPTSGPMTITFFEGILSSCYELKSPDGIVAIFPVRYPETVSPGPAAKTKEQAEANARAWVDGREAMDKLERIRSALDGVTSLNKGDLPSKIRSILDEAKP